MKNTSFYAKVNRVVRPLPGSMDKNQKKGAQIIDGKVKNSNLYSSFAHLSGIVLMHMSSKNMDLLDPDFLKPNHRI